MSRNKFSWVTVTRNVLHEKWVVSEVDGILQGKVVTIIIIFEVKRAAHVK